MTYYPVAGAMRINNPGGSNNVYYLLKDHLGSARVVNGQTFTLGYDAENRLVSVSGAANASFVYDGDGRRVKSTVNGTTTYFIGAHYELTGSQVTKFYFAGARPVVNTR